jgi:hypothetical protein
LNVTVPVGLPPPETVAVSAIEEPTVIVAGCWLVVIDGVAGVTVKVIVTDGSPITEFVSVPVVVIVPGVYEASLAGMVCAPSAKSVYIPADRIVGFSKLARVTELFAGRLQVQERLTQQIASFLEEQLAPRGVGVLVEAEYCCASVRKLHASGARVLTVGARGLLRDHNTAGQEFMDVVRATNR